MRIVRYLVFHGLVVILFSVLGMCTSFLFGSIWGFVVMALAWIPLLVLSASFASRFSREPFQVHWLFFLLILIPVYVTTSNFPVLCQLYRADAVPVVSADESTNHPDAPVLKFSDAIVQHELRYIRIAKSYDSRKSTTTTNYYVVAPITNHSWDRNQLVTAWAVHSPSSATRELGPYWTIENGIGYDCDEVGREAFRETVREACVDGGLTSTSNPRLLHWSQSIGSAISDRLQLLWIGTLGMYLVWSIYFVCETGIRGRTIKPTA